MADNEGQVGAAAFGGAAPGMGFFRLGDWEWRIAYGRGMMFRVGEGLGPRILRRSSAMQITLPRMVWITAILVAAAPTPPARAQGLGQPRFGVVPTATTIRVQTTVMVPDVGTALVGG